MVAVLGILKAGAAYLPLDPEYPELRLQYLLDDANVVLVITDQKSRGLFTRAEKESIDLDEAISTCANAPNSTHAGSPRQPRLRHLYFRDRPESPRASP